MDLDDTITISKVSILNDRYYLMIGWQKKSFDMYIYGSKDNIWEGRFSQKRLQGFSKNLHMSESDYFKSIRQCLSQHKKDYRYELRSGFFYWKRKLHDTVVIEGFLPVEPVSNNIHPDLVEILLSLNRHLKDKVNDLKNQYKSIQSDYEKCLGDTKEFLSLKVEMEKALCAKFLNLLNMKKENKSDDIVTEEKSEQ